MIVRVTHVCDLLFDDHLDQSDMLDIATNAIGIMIGQAEGRDRIRSERTSIELIYKSDASYPSGNGSDL